MSLRRSVIRHAALLGWTTRSLVEATEADDRSSVA